MKKAAIIDLGSNSVRMSIFELDKWGGYRETQNFRSLIKLSEGMTRDMRLTPEAQLRAVEALLHFASIIRSENVCEVRAVATAAVRKAKNGSEFLRMLFCETGISVEVIDGEREAYLDFLAVRAKTPYRSGIICDIGGGSCEFIHVSDGDAPMSAVSLPFGSRSLTETFFANGETPEVFVKAKDFVTERLKAELDLTALCGLPVIGIGGTMRAVAQYDGYSNASAVYEADRAHAEELFERILKASFAERAEMRGIGVERADIIAGGIIPLICLNELTGSPRLAVADIGVRDGIIAEIAAGGRKL